MKVFESVWTELLVLRYDVGYYKTIDDYSANSWPIVGRFKCHNRIAGCYLIPIAGRTKSGIKFFSWTQCFSIYLEHRGIVEGWAFQQRDGTRDKFVDYWRNIFRKLEMI